MVQEVAELRAQFAEQEGLADLVEDALALAQAELGPMGGQQPMPERVEVVHPQPTRPLDPERLLEPARELRGRADVVGQDEDVLGLEGASPRAARLQ